MDLTSTANCTAVILSTAPLKILETTDGDVRDVRLYNGTITQEDIGRIHDAGPYGNVTMQRYTATALWRWGAGTISEWYYSTNTHGSWGSCTTTIDRDGNGVADASSDCLLHRLAMTLAGINSARGDVNAEGRFVVLPNPGAEQWISTNTTLPINNAAFLNVVNFPYAWSYQQVVSVNTTGSVSRSTMAHSGNYSVNISRVNGTGSMFSHYTVGALPAGVYNFSVWAYLSGSTSVKAHIQNLNDYGSFCNSGTTTTQGSWVQISCQANLTTPVAQGYRLVIETSGSDNTFVLWDDAQLLYNGGLYRGIINTAGQANVTAWHCNQGMKILWIASYTPLSMAKLNTNCEGNPSRCGIADPDLYANMTVLWLENITQNGTYASCVEIEVWNEPDLRGFWNSSSVRQERIDDMLALYDRIEYRVHQRFPAMKVGGLGLASVATNTDGLAFFEQFIAAYGNRTDFISWHKYDCDGCDFNTDLRDSYANVERICRKYNVTCNNIYLDEYNVWNELTKRESPAEHAKQFYLGNQYLLTRRPGAYRAYSYQWSEGRPYNLTNTALYGEWPQRWVLFSEPGLDAGADAAYYAHYNVTRDLAMYHPAGSAVGVIIPNDTSGIAGMVTRNETEYHVSMVNLQWVNASVDLSLVGVTGAQRLIGLNNPGNYSVNASGVVQNVTLPPGYPQHYRVERSCYSEQQELVRQLNCNASNCVYLTSCVHNEAWQKTSQCNATSCA
jgi:hypothetical protein